MKAKVNFIELDIDFQKKNLRQRTLLRYENMYFSFHHHLVCRIIRTQFPLQQVLLEPSSYSLEPRSHFGKHVSQRVDQQSANCRPMRQPTVGRDFIFIS